ncbi:MAG: GPW/gp25 family protein [Clostridium beijerinckii]|jgi:phage baseplate assembly protein W|nr:GPW/gp25 family protein [Clostridium beijerinckii]MCI1578574.1 GPW/gp25 family protein [Clostridium beijerinckii]MCI1582094.1 GPW/gp25 family protein [Clostridium beijerinckii]MCI1621944.1 GPW/gp25 family protein [Clostridium beijerinckii]
MDYVVNSDNVLINWNAKENDRILQNINNILNTMKYEVPYDRLMGRDPKNLDGNFEKNKAAIIEETYDLINTYETRAIVKSVTVEYKESEENKYIKIPVIKVVISI